MQGSYYVGWAKITSESLIGSHLGPQQLDESQIEDGGAHHA